MRVFGSELRRVLSMALNNEGAVRRGAVMLGLIAKGRTAIGKVR